MRLVTQWDGGPGGWEAGRQVGWQPVRSKRLRWRVLVVVGWQDAFVVRWRCIEASGRWFGHI